MDLGVVLVRVPNSWAEANRLNHQEYNQVDFPPAFTNENRLVAQWSKYCVEMN